MLLDAAQFLLRTLFDLMACAFFLRFWMQWTRVPFRNPFAQFVLQVTDFAVRPLRRIVPGLFGIDWASLILLYLSELLLTLALLWLLDYPFAVAGPGLIVGCLVMALAATLRMALYVFMGMVILQAILSWVNPFSPLAPVFYALARPVLAPFQRLIPTFSGIDLSPVATLIVIQLLQIAPVAGLERLGRGMVW